MKILVYKTTQNAVDSEVSRAIIGEAVFVNDGQKIDELLIQDFRVGSFGSLNLYLSATFNSANRNWCIKITNGINKIHGADPLLMVMSDFASRSPYALVRVDAGTWIELFPEIGTVTVSGGNAGSDYSK